MTIDPQAPCLAPRDLRWTHQVGDPDGVQVGGVVGVLQVGQGGAEFVVDPLAAVVVPLHVEQVGHHVDSCGAPRRTFNQQLPEFSSSERPLVNICSGFIISSVSKPRDSKARASLESAA